MGRNIWLLTGFSVGLLDEICMERKVVMFMDIELIVQNGDKIYQPCVLDGVTWQTYRSGVAGQLVFKVLYDSRLEISQGNAVRFSVNGECVFYGFIFTMNTDKTGLMTVTAYDQLRYLKNKDTYVYGNITAGELVRTIAEDFMLNVGEIADTGYIIPSRIEENTALFDIIGNGFGLTLENKKEMFVLFDDCGKLCLKNVLDMVVGLVIDSVTGESFSFTSSIDNESYNKIKLTYDNSETGVREIYISQDSQNINSWGVLQYFEKLSDNENGSVKADSLLELYNREKQQLSVSGVFGDNRIRGGVMVVVNLDLFGVAVNSLMLVERCKHYYSQGLHTMELELRGGF